MRLRRPQRPFGFKSEARLKIEEVANKIVNGLKEKGYIEVFCKPIRFEKMYIGFSLQYQEGDGVKDKLFVYKDSQQDIKEWLYSEYNSHYLGSEIILIDSYQEVIGERK